MVSIHKVPRCCITDYQGYMFYISVQVWSHLFIYWEALVNLRNK